MELMWRNARHRCEIAFIARLFHIIIVCGLKMPSKEEHECLEDYAFEALLEPLEGLYGNERAVIRRRVQRMEEKTIAPLSTKAHGKKIMLIIYYFINALIDDDYIEIPEGSRLRWISDYLLELLNPEDESVKNRMSSSAKMARKWLDLLRQEGYYQH